MSKKRYYWLKLSTDFFNSLEIKKLRRIAGGDTYTIIYLKLMLMSLQDEGYINFEGVGKNIIEELAIKIDEDEDNVKMTLSYLQGVGLLVSMSGNTNHLIQVEEMTGSENESAQRVRKHRQRQALLEVKEPGELQKIEEKALHCSAVVTECNNHETISNIEIELDIEKEIELDIEKELNIFVPLATEGGDKSEDTPRVISEESHKDTPTMHTFATEFKKAWNDIDPNIPQIKDVKSGTKRYNMLKARLNQYGSKSILDAVDEVKKSDFLKGYVTDFVINVDWFLKPNNFIKILEGNYKERQKPKSANSTQDFYDNIDKWTQELSERTGT